jgi:hypothetical protein
MSSFIVSIIIPVEIPVCVIFVNVIFLNIHSGPLPPSEILFQTNFKKKKE